MADFVLWLNTDPNVVAIRNLWIIVSVPLVIVLWRRQER